VLWSHRSVEVPELGACVATHAILHARYRLHAVYNTCVVCEDALVLRSFDRRGHVGRPIATVLLDGAARIGAHDRSVWMTPGDVLAMDAKGAIVMRQEGPRYAALSFEWDPGFLGPRPEPFRAARLPEATRADLEAVFSQVVAGEASFEAVLRVVVALRDAGVDLRPPTPDECIEAIPERTAALAATIDALFSRLDEQPMLSDLERALGVSSRQLNRLIAAFNERYGFNAVGWRDARNRRRLFVGAALMTAPDATGEVVARAVGYRTLSAFTNALTEAGLPSPSAIPGVISSLRADPAKAPTA
jgi:AraC-like DNA-binding protein